MRVAVPSPQPACGGPLRRARPPAAWLRRAEARRRARCARILRARRRPWRTSAIRPALACGVAPLGPGGETAPPLTRRCRLAGLAGGIGLWCRPGVLWFCHLAPARRMGTPSHPIAPGRRAGSARATEQTPQAPGGPARAKPRGRPRDESHAQANSTPANGAPATVFARRVATGENCRGASGRPSPPTAPGRRRWRRRRRRRGRGGRCCRTGPGAASARCRGWGSRGRRSPRAASRPG